MHKRRKINAHGESAPPGSPQAQHAATFVHHPPTGEPVAASTAGGVLLGVLLIAQLMVILDITAVNIALPSLALILT